MACSFSYILGNGINSELKKLGRRLMRNIFVSLYKICSLQLCPAQGKITRRESMLLSRYNIRLKLEKIILTLNIKR